MRKNLTTSTKFVKNSLFAIVLLVLSSSIYAVPPTPDWEEKTYSYFALVDLYELYDNSEEEVEVYMEDVLVKLGLTIEGTVLSEVAGQIAGILNPITSVIWGILTSIPSVGNPPPR